MATRLVSSSQYAQRDTARLFFFVVELGAYIVAWRIEKDVLYKSAFFTQESFWLHVEAKASTDGDIPP